MADGELLDAREAMSILGINENELQTLVARGDLRAFRSAGTMKFRRDDVSSLKSEKGTEPTIIIPASGAKKTGGSGILPTVGGAPPKRPSGIGQAVPQQPVMAASQHSTGDDTGQIVLEDIELMPTDDAAGTQQVTIQTGTHTAGGQTVVEPGTSSASITGDMTVLEGGSRASTRTEFGHCGHHGRRFRREAWTSGIRNRSGRYAKHEPRAARSSAAGRQHGDLAAHGGRVSAEDRASVHDCDHDSEHCCLRLRCQHRGSDDDPRQLRQGYGQPHHPSFPESQEPAAGLQDLLCKDARRSKGSASIRKNSMGRRGAAVSKLILNPYEIGNRQAYACRFSFRWHGPLAHKYLLPRHPHSWVRGSHATNRLPRIRRTAAHGVPRTAG